MMNHGVSGAARGRYYARDSISYAATVPQCCLVAHTCIALYTEVEYLFGLQMVREEEHFKLVRSCEKWLTMLPLLPVCCAGAWSLMGKSGIRRLG